MHFSLKINDIFFLTKNLFFSQLRSSFCSSLHSYRERIGLVPSPLCPSCGLAPHTTVHVFSYSSHPTPLTEFDLWKRPRLAPDFLLDILFFDLPPVPPPKPESFLPFCRIRGLGAKIIITTECIGKLYINMF